MVAESIENKIIDPQVSRCILAELAVSGKKQPLSNVLEALGEDNPNLERYEHFEAIRGAGLIQTFGEELDGVMVGLTVRGKEIGMMYAGVIGKDNVHPRFPEEPSLAQTIRGKLAQLTSQLICSIS